jgi:hypothetical protein
VFDYGFAPDLCNVFAFRQEKLSELFPRSAAVFKPNAHRCSERTGASATSVLLEDFCRTCYFWVMSERLYSKSCPECGGVCPLQAQACRYCNSNFPGGRKFSLDWRVARVGSLRRVAIWVAILMIVVLFFINILRG